jgi:beta-galactosidase
MSEYFQDVSVFSINTEKRNGAGFPQDTKGIDKKQSLNGVWKFKYLDSVNDIPSGYYLPDADLSSFGTIEVPSEWQIKGYGTPIYSNTRYPYALESKKKKLIPFVHADKAPCGLYVTEFDYVKTDDNVFINFGGINSAGEIFLNGNFVGYSEDTFDQTEYDITKYVLEG